MASDGSAPLGSTGVDADLGCRRPNSLGGPSASSTLTAGMLSDWASAMRIVTVPCQSWSKFLGT